MADRLRTDYDTLVSLANALQSAHDELIQQFTLVQNAIAVCVPAASWQGPASGAFYQWWTNAMPIPNKVFQQLDTFPEDVRTIIGMIQSTDADGASPFGQLASGD